MEQIPKQQKLEELYQLLAKTDDPRAIAALFDDLCTRKELDNMAERLFAAKLLLEGNTYSQVMAQADISSATLSRVSRCGQYGEGYSKLLKYRDRPDANASGRFSLSKNPFGLFRQFLQSASRIIRFPSANEFHTCSLRSILCQVHTPAQNVLDFVFRLCGQFCEAF